MTFAPVRTVDGVPSSVTFVFVGTCEDDIEFAPKSVSVMEDGTKVPLSPRVDSAEIIPNSDPDVTSWEFDLLDVAEVLVKLIPESVPVGREEEEGDVSLNSLVENSVEVNP